MAVDNPSLGNFPRRGPAIQTTTSALNPPRTWIVAAPPTSRNPKPSEKLSPSWASQPAPQIQCETKGKTSAARTAAEAAPAVKRQRSAPDPQGMRTARDKARNSNSSVSWARIGEEERPLSAIGPVPAQFHGID